LEVVTVRRVSLAAIERGWGELLRLAASIRSGRVSATLALQRFGSAAQGDPLHRAAEHLGRLLRTVFLCDYIAIEDFRREIHTLLNRASRYTSCSAPCTRARWRPNVAGGVKR
jgi:TnpA family transposase